MFSDFSVWCVVPAFNEERLLPRMLQRCSVLIDRVIVVDDASGDATAARAEASGDPRVQVLRHATNQGVGAAIRSGYLAALDAGADLVVVMAADDQMDPADLPRLLEPLIDGRADYVKGNRLIHADARRMPLGRRGAAYVLGFITSLATGYALSDSQCGYTAISRAALQRLDLDELWPRYGYPNDLLALAARAGLRVSEIAVAPVYADETSGIRPYHFFSVCALIARRWARERARRLVPQGKSFGGLRKSIT
ncbi:MAG: glycosyltransferase family 2 protein [Polyangiaceae bacterium]